MIVKRNADFSKLFDMLIEFATRESPKDLGRDDDAGILVLFCLCTVYDAGRCRRGFTFTS